jgi:TAG lipase/steryl ester hydrolase/phospholipase A2/LPA acyltransferase
MFLKGESVLDSEHLRTVVRKSIGDLTFKEVHDMYKWCLNISVTDSLKHDESRLMNYLTTPDVVIWSAVSASCAIPGFFDSVELMIKTQSGEIVPYHPENIMTRYIDGSVGGDLPMQRMSELFNVNTFIVSQVNPHVVPFLSVDGGGILESRTRKRLSMTVKAVIGNEVKHFITQMTTLGLIPLEVRRTLNLVTQQYKGHVTIVPQPKISAYKNILINPNHAEYKEAIH